MRAKSVYLTEDQMEVISIHVIKQLGAEIDKDGNFILNDKGEVDFRVPQGRLAQEVSPTLGFVINGYQVHKSVNWYARGAKRFKTTIVVPVQASVEENKLKITIAKLEGEITKLNKKVEEQKVLLNESYNKFKQLKELFK